MRIEIGQYDPGVILNLLLLVQHHGAQYFHLFVKFFVVSSLGQVCGILYHLSYNELMFYLSYHSDEHVM